MVISEDNKKFLEDLLQYYVDQAESYTQFANEYSNFSSSNKEIAFGIIIGTVYSAFLQTYANQELEINLEDIERIANNGFEKFKKGANLKKNSQNFLKFLKTI